MMIPSLFMIVKRESMYPSSDRTISFFFFQGQNERYLVKNMVSILYILFMERNKSYTDQRKSMVGIFH